MSGLWGQFAHLMTRQQARIDARFDRLEADVAGLKTDVARLKEHLGSLERASESRANRG